jgi:hypothetical protein
MAIGVLDVTGDGFHKSLPEVFARQIQKVEPLKAAAGPGGSQAHD